MMPPDKTNDASADVAETAQLKVSGTDRFTMAEAARLKGVSYHTVSRAVRRGRLPVHRLGRMALIAADDLNAWTPMKERAPRKYQTRQPALSATPSLLDVVTGEGADLVQGLATLYETIHVAAYQRSLPEFAVTVRDQVVQAFKLDRVVVWAFDEEMRVATRLTRTASVRTRFPDQVQVADFPVFRTLTLANNARIVVELSAEDPDIGTYFPPLERPQTVLVAPLRVGDRLLGLIVGDRSGARFDLDGNELALVQGLVNQIALALANAQQRDRSQRRAGLLEGILEDLPEAICAVDAGGKVMLSNRAFRTIAGSDGTASLADDGAMHPQSFLSADVRDLPIAGPDLSRALAGEDTARSDRQLVGEGPDFRTLSVSARRIQRGNELAGAAAIARDVTASREDIQRRLEHVQALEEATRKAELVAEVVTEVNAGKTIHEVTDIAVVSLVQKMEGDSGLVALREGDGRFRLLGTYNLNLPPDFVLSFDPISYPNTILAFARQSPIYVNVEEVSTFERQMMGLMSWQGLLIVPFQQGDEQLGFVLVGYNEAPLVEKVDMTFAATLGVQCAHALEKVRLIDALESVHRRLLTVVDQIPQAVVIVSYPEGLVTIANKAAETLWGTSLRGGDMLADRLPVLDPEGVVYDRDTHPLLRSVRTGRSYLGEPLTIKRDDGGTIEVLSNHAPIFTASGAISGAVSILQDRAHFKPLDRVKDEFLSVVAHELRNPITSLRGNLQLLERRIRRTGEVPAEEGLKRVEAVLGQVDRITELVSRLLDISRADLGKLDITSGQTDAAALVQKVSDEGVGMSPEREIRVSSPAHVPVVWDEVRVEQILINLLTNAIRYAPDGPIEIAVSETDDEVIHISVRDHGPGVPAWIRPRLFKQYYRFDDGRKDRERALDGNHGLGIGLYLSERLANAHGGALDVEDAPGGGMIFTLSIPRIARTES